MTATFEPTDRYTIISSDCHAGGDIPDYRVPADATSSIFQEITDRPW